MVIETEKMLISENLTVSTQTPKYIESNEKM